MRAQGAASRAASGRMLAGGARPHGVGDSRMVDGGGADCRCIGAARIVPFVCGTRLQGIARLRFARGAVAAWCLPRCGSPERQSREAAGVRDSVSCGYIRRVFIGLLLGQVVSRPRWITVGDFKKSHQSRGISGIRT